MKSFSFALAVALAFISSSLVHAGPARNHGVQVQEYTYDFSTDGGAVGIISLSAKKATPPLPVGAIVKHVTQKVLVAPLSGGSATLAVGTTAAPSGYMAATAKATLAANYVANEQMGAGTLVWDGTGKTNIPYLVLDAATGAFNITVGTAALTAGKIQYQVEYYFPSL